MISVIIPTYNDEQTINTTISNLQQNAYKRLLKEIIVVDGGSSDNTVSEAEKAGAVVIRSIRKNRAVQLNLGAQYATGKILYFIAPGSTPPKHFTNEIVRATQQGFFFGFFTMKFDYQNWILNMLSQLTKNRIKFSRLDNQSLFVIQELFEKTGKFREDHMLHEDTEMINRLKRYSRYTILKEQVIPYTQKYHQHGLLRAEIAYLITHLMYVRGFSQEKLQKAYHWLLGDKIFQRQPQNALSASLN